MDHVAGVTGLEPVEMPESKSGALPTWLIPNKKLVCLKGFEPLTPALEGRCSIQLSYRHICKMERVKGIEPSQSAWKAGALPLSYTRMLNTLNFYWSGRRDSNPRPSPWQGDALPLSHFRVVVRLEGLEPPRTGRQILSLVRLPIPPQPHLIWSWQ